MDYPNSIPKPVERSECITNLNLLPLRGPLTAATRTNAAGACGVRLVYVISAIQA
jgi:hypothetical protein